MAGAQKTVKLTISTEINPRVSTRSRKPYERSLYLARRASPDWPAVKRLLDKAAAESDPKAHYALATWYLFGHEPLAIEKNIKKATPLLKFAADRGVPEALFDLAVCYETGQGVAKSEAKAFVLYTEAALRDDADSMFEISRMYSYGIGVKKNRKLASIWREASKRADEAKQADKKVRSRK